MFRFLVITSLTYYGCLEFNHLSLSIRNLNLRKKFIIQSQLITIVAEGVFITEATAPAIIHTRRR